MLSSNLTQRGFETSEGEIWVGFMARIKVIRRGTHNTLSDTVDDPAAFRARYDAIREQI